MQVRIKTDISVTEWRCEECNKDMSGSLYVIDKGPGYSDVMTLKCPHCGATKDLVVYVSIEPPKIGVSLTRSKRHLSADVERMIKGKYPNVDVYIFKNFSRNVVVTPVTFSLEEHDNLLKDFTDIIDEKRV